MKVAGTVAERPAVVSERLDRLAQPNGDDVKHLASSAGDAPVTTPRREALDATLFVSRLQRTSADSRWLE
jgi:hypothetical protein